MKKAPVSVVIPCYNSEKYLENTLKSVFNQTLPVSEIIVVDNNSTDKTVEIAKRLGAKVITEKKQGSAAARNAGMKAAENEWIAFLDSDDIWNPHKIELQMKAAEVFAGASFITCEYQRIYPNDNKTERNPALRETLSRFEQFVSHGDLFGFCDNIDFSLYQHLYLRTSAAMIHKSILDKVGFFDEKIKVNQDIEFYLRILKDNSVAIVLDVLVDYMMHSSNISNDYERKMTYTFRNLEKITRFPDNYLDGSEAKFREFLQQQTMLAMIEKAKLAKECGTTLDSSVDIFQ